MSDVQEPAHPSLPQHADLEPRLPYSGWWAVVAGALAGLLLRLIFWGSPGHSYSAMLDSFLYGSPMLVGVVTVYIAELGARRSWGYYFVVPVMATALYVVGTLLVFIEGWICAIVIIPLFALIGGLAGLVMGAICRVTHWPRRAVVGCIAALPLLGGAVEPLIPSPDRERAQQREIWIAAPAEQVWRELVDVRAIAPGEVDGWMYRIGVPLPNAGRGGLQAGEHVRHITMGKGIRFDQVATEWRENTRVSWRYRFDADSFPPGALDDHVRIGGEYFDLGQTTYSLQPQGAGTRLTLRMQYRVSTHFNWYAGPVADFLVGDFAEHILAFYARRAEHTAAGAGR